MAPLTPKHLILALMTILIWGTNFIAIFMALEELPPFLFVALRLGLSALPFALFLPRPQGPIKYIIGYGIFNYALQFGLLFSGIHLGLSPGLASLVLQIQVIFSLGLAFLLFRDRPSPMQIFGALISFLGIALVASNIDTGGTILGLLLTLLAALSWSLGNVMVKKVNSKSALSLVVWGNLVAFPFMLATAFFVDGPALILDSLSELSWGAVLSVAFVVYISTHLGYGMWSFLMKTYPTSSVVPFTLLIPVVGLLSSALFLGEEMAPWKWWATLLIMAGLIFNLLEKQLLGLIPQRRHRRGIKVHGHKGK